MKILVVHNHYGDFALGGEASVVRAEVALLRSKGHEVYLYERTNSEITEGSFSKKIKSVVNLTWSKNSQREISKILQSFEPDIMHVHNYKWLLTPSIFAAAEKFHVSVVHTLHNYWLSAPCASLMRDSAPCELCLQKKNPKYILKYRCRGEKNFLLSLTNYIYFRSIEKKNKLQDYIDIYISLTGFASEKYVQAGIPAEKIVVKPNFLTEPSLSKKTDETRPYALFVGRLAKEKGIQSLVDAWQEIDFKLKVVGEGPEDKIISKENPNIEFLGSKSQQEVYDLLRNSTFFIFPSLWYEGFPISLLEAMAMAKPIIASDLGARSEMIQHEHSGLLYNPAKKEELISSIKKLINNKSAAIEMGKNARKKYLAKYNSELNYRQLLNIYKTAIKNREQRTTA